MGCLITACDNAGSELSYLSWGWDAYNSPQYKNSIWATMGEQFKLDHYTRRPEVKAQIRWLQQHQHYVYRNLSAAAPYIYYIYQQTQAKHLPAELALLPFIESQYNPYARSYVGADGLWQLMPATASHLGVKMNHAYDGRRDIITSTNAALDYFETLHQLFNGNWTLAIAAYNGGSGTVQTAMRRHRYFFHKPTFWDLYLPAQTHAYVPKLLALAAVIQDPGKYHIQLPPINNVPYFAAVNVKKRINLAQAAKSVGVSVSTMHTLNPGYRGANTDPKTGTSTLLIPIGKLAAFEAKLASLISHKKDGTEIASSASSTIDVPHYYSVRKGDTLSRIAKRYHISIAELKQSNHLHSNRLRAKQSLTIPGYTAIEMATGSRKNAVKVAANTSHSHINAHAKDSSFAGLSHKYLQHSIYHVAKGDDLTKIARQYRTSVRKLRAENHLRNDRLHLGQTLTIHSTAAALVENDDNSRTE